jgi:hypothetical protein
MNVIHCLRLATCSVCAIVVLAGQASWSIGQTVLVDFGNNAAQYRGIPVPDPDPKGHYWNSIQPGLLVTDMRDINNMTTTIDLGWHTPVGTDSYNGPAGDTSFGTPADNVPFTDIDTVALGDLGVKEAAFDYAASPIQDDTRCQFDLQGLDPNKKYSLTFYGSHKYSNDPITVYSVYSDATYTTLLGTASLNVMDPNNPTDASKHNRDRVVTISNLSPPVNTGILYVQFDGSTGNLGYLNAMEVIASVPAGINGDYNNNGKVDAADYAIWRKNVGTMNTLPNDPTGGTIGDAQYNTWRANFGSGGPGAGNVLGGAVPEPTSFLMAAVPAAALFLCRRR